MKKMFLFSMLLFLANAMYGQTVPPQSFSYHGIARNSSGNVISSGTIGLALQITDEFNNAIYEEQFDTITDAYGSFTVRIGGGNIMYGIFESIDWASGPKYLSVYFSQSPGSPFINLGTVPFLSVPYAFVTERIKLPYLDDTDELSTNNAALNIAYTGSDDDGSAIKGTLNNSAIHGAGVWGEAFGAYQYGVAGSTSGTNGVAVMAYAGAPQSTALYATASDQGKALHVVGGNVLIHNNPSGANLNILRYSSDPANIRFSNVSDPGQFWQINALNGVSTPSGGSNDKFSINYNGYDIFTVKNNGGVWINGPLMPYNNAGTTGQVLTSAGPGSAPYWTTPAAPPSVPNLYNTTFLFDQGSNLAVNTTFIMDVPGLSNQSFILTGHSKVILNFSHSKIFNAGNFGGGNAKIKFIIQFTGPNSAAIVNQAEVFAIVPNGENGTVSYTHHCWFSTPGTYQVKVMAQWVSGDTDVTLMGVGPGNVSNGQVSMQVVPAN